jgi:hypothetical protein
MNSRVESDLLGDISECLIDEIVSPVGTYLISAIAPFVVAVLGTAWSRCAQMVLEPSLELNLLMLLVRA